MFRVPSPLRRHWRLPALAAALALAYAAGVTVERRRLAREADWQGARLLSQAIDSVRVNALDSLPSEELIRRAVAGMLRELHDPYAAVLRSEGVEQWRGTLQGEGHGLGLTLRREASGASVVRVASGSPAMTAGLRPGDRILTVDGQPVLQAWRARPADGTTRAPVQVMTVWRAPTGDVDTVLVRRVPWHLPAVSEQAMLTDGVGYVRLASITLRAAEELEAAVMRLEARGARALVLDLRDNGGGLFDEGVKVAGLFLPRGAVVASLATRPGVATTAFRARSGRWTTLPLTVLVNGGTASAAEVIAAALRDHDRALLVGAPTYGKGVVQRVVRLSSDLSLRLTTARWLTPEGATLERRHNTPRGAVGGLAPNVRLDDAARREAFTVPTWWTPELAQRTAQLADSAAMQALRDRWAVTPLALLEARLRLVLDTLAPRGGAAAGAGARQEWLMVATRQATVRMLEIERANEPLLRLAARDDAAMRAALDVLEAPTVRVAMTDARATDSTSRAAAGDTIRAERARARGARTVRQADASRDRLDRWLVQRYGPAMLRPDTGGTTPVLATLDLAPRVEGVMAGRQRDTLVVLHFGDGASTAAFEAGHDARLVHDATPAIGGAKVLSRRAFRVPHVPSARSADSTAWRAGWAYLVAVPHVEARPAARWRGWQLTRVPEPTRRVASSRAVARPAPADSMARP
ncbi:MAG: PDZ domain-containing protein [Gemmatimonadetes bacterium]|nr:PDZ domain-containing protein [Gemmatimonadota bacterium]